jgi:hypothetical protein
MIGGRLLATRGLGGTRGGGGGGLSGDVDARALTTTHAVRFGPFGTTPTGLGDTDNPLIHASGSMVVSETLRVNHVVANTVTQVSDARLKTHVKPLDASTASDFIAKLQPVTYRMVSPKSATSSSSLLSVASTETEAEAEAGAAAVADPSSPHATPPDHSSTQRSGTQCSGKHDYTVGFIAQHVQTLDSSLVHVDSGGTNSVDYRALSVHNICATQTLLQEVARLRQAFAQIESRLPP